MIPLDSIYQQLDRSRATLKLLVVDACRSNPTRAAGGKTMSRGFASSLRKPPRGLLLLTSCGEGQVAFEEPTFGHGVFMHFVLDGLAGKAADEDGDVTLTGLYAYASSHTKKYVATKFSGFQTPALEGKIDADFELCRVDRNSLPATPLPAIRCRDRPQPPARHAGQRDHQLDRHEVGAHSGWRVFDGLAGAGIRPATRSEKQHRVRITKPFYLGVYEVTLDEFLKFYEAANYKSRWKTQGNKSAGGLKPKNGKYELDCRCAVCSLELGASRSNAAASGGGRELERRGGIL